MRKGEIGQNDCGWKRGVIASIKGAKRGDSNSGAENEGGLIIAHYVKPLVVIICLR